MASQRHRREAAEEAVLLPVRPGCEVDGANVAAGASVPRPQAPQPGNIRISCPLELTTVPRNSPVPRSKALMRPSPKLPIKMDPANPPKLAGACAKPHGEFKCPCCMNRAIIWPLGSKVFTKPCAWPSSRWRIVYLPIAQNPVLRWVHYFSTVFHRLTEPSQFRLDAADNQPPFNAPNSR